MWFDTGENILLINAKIISTLKSFWSLNERLNGSIFIEIIFMITFWHSGKWWVTALHMESSVTGVTEEHVVLKGVGV